MAASRSTATFAQDPQEALKSYLAVGYHLEPNVWSPLERKSLIEDARSLPSFKDGTYSPDMQVHRGHRAFLKAFCNPRIIGIMERLVSGPVSGIQTEFFFCKPGIHGFSLHQDNAYVRAAPDAFASAWSALEDAFPENGGLIVYPGTHREPILPTRPVDNPPQSPHQDPNAQREEVVLPGGYEPVFLSVPAGAVVFLHANIVHGSNANKTRDRFRHVLLATYVRRGTAFRPGLYARRAEVDVYRVDDS